MLSKFSKEIVHSFLGDTRLNKKGLQDLYKYLNTFDFKISNIQSKII